MVSELYLDRLQMQRRDKRIAEKLVIGAGVVVMGFLGMVLAAC